ncbi:uncharacterized protein SCHCODRAFT_02753637 [Schizophyllum commune H4-8]|nr:uncharacterized protein SCHCODRAFT_02753637 [Schizophyllum commune H4-8]KAI5885354.1 hypothetical protein SCHCODRAFT_02753637 [Schizophyllum commune H4-8]
MNQPGAQNRPGNAAGGSGIAQGWPLPTRGARSRTTRQLNAQAGPSSQLPQPAVTHNEYPTPPPTYSSPAPAADPALPAAPATQQSPASILERIGQQLADNHDEMIEHLDENFDLIIQHLEGLNGTMRQIRDTNLNTLSESFHSANAEVFALNDAGAPPAPTADPNVRAENAVSMQPEPLADSETYSSMYASTETETPRASAPLGRPSMIAGAASSLPPAAAGHDRQPLGSQPSGELGGEGSAHGERTLRRRHAFRSLSLPVDEASNIAAGTGGNASTSLDANRIFSRPASILSAGVDQETGWQGPLGMPHPAPNAATTGDYEPQAVDAQAELVEDPVLTLVGCRATSELCPGTLQLVIDVGTDGVIDKGDMLLFFGDFDMAIQRLPGICAERAVEWSQLFLRIRRSNFKGQDAMLKVMQGLRSYLHCFIGVQLVMDERAVPCDLPEQADFADGFARLLSLSVDGGVTLDRLFLFPLYNLRHLVIRSMMNTANMSAILCRAKMLDILCLDNRGAFDRIRGTRLAEISPDASIPPAMYIEADNPTALLPLFRAADSVTTNIRLRVRGGRVSSQVQNLFAHHASWTLATQ